MTRNENKGSVKKKKKKAHDVKGMMYQKKFSHTEMYLKTHNSSLMFQVRSANFGT